MEQNRFQYYCCDDELGACMFWVCCCRHMEINCMYALRVILAARFLLILTC